MSKKHYSKSNRKRKKSTGGSDGLLMIFGCIVGFMALKTYYPDLFVFGLVILFAILALTVAINVLKKRNLLFASEDDVAGMSGIQFEEYCIAHFQKLGYRTESTPLSGDYGADIILRKNGVKTVVQCKRYKGSVGISAVQEVIGAKGYYNADKMLVITNSYFTQAAKDLAAANGVELWDKKKMQRNFR